MFRLTTTGRLRPVRCSDREQRCCLCRVQCLVSVIFALHRAATARGPCGGPSEATPRAARARRAYLVKGRRARNK